MAKMFIEKEPHDWANYLENSDYPVNRYMVIAANISTLIIALTPTWFGPWMCKTITNNLGQVHVKDQPSKSEKTSEH